MQAVVIDELAKGNRVVLLDSTVMGADHYVDQDYAGALGELGPLAPGLKDDFDVKRRERVATRDL